MRLRAALLGLPTLALLFFLGFAPGFAGPSYAFTLAAGLILGPTAALMAARLAHSLQLARGPAVAYGFLLGGGLAGAAGLISLFHGARIGFCDPGQDYLRFALGPAPGALCGGLWGATVGTLLPRGRGMRALAVGSALGLPVLSYLVSGVRFYMSPIVFAFDHFVGYFAGTLYDTELGSLERLWTYRLATLGLLVAGTGALTLLRREGDEPQLEAIRRPWASGASMLGLALAVGITLNGERLGHYQTTDSIVRALGNHAEAGRCEVIFGNGTRRGEASLLARECEAHLEELESYFQVRAPERIRVFLFDSAVQKAALMGARHVYVAKPWRREIYLQPSGFPHPVLGHELAHVVAGQFAAGPFKVAGEWGGLVPDPGRIEGLAVAASPSETGNLTLRQWAASMHHLRLLPRLGDIFHLGFFGSNSSVAYTVAGAFIDWLRDEHGIEAVKRWYAGADLTASAGLSLQDLERTFVAVLAEIPLTEAQLGVARARFDRPAVLQRRCAHQVDAALSASHALVARGDPDAPLVLQQVLAMDPTALQAELELGRYYQIEDQLQIAEATYRGVAANVAASVLLRASALERVGDVVWLQGNLDAANRVYAEVQQLIVDEDWLRTLDVKRTAVSSPDPEERAALKALFFGTGTHAGRANPVLTGEVLGSWAKARGAALAHYLLGKQYLAASEWQLAHARFARAVEAGLESARIRHEALRGLLVSACATESLEATREAWAALLEEEAFPHARKAALARFAKRCGVDATSVVDP